MNHTDEFIKEISEKIDSKKEYYVEISNKIWEFAEPRFQGNTDLLNCCSMY